MIVTVHDVAHLVLDDIGWVKKTYAKMLFAAVRHKAQAVITVSHFTKKEFLRRVGTPRGAIIPIHNGVDAAWSTGCVPKKPSIASFTACLFARHPTGKKQHPENILAAVVEKAYPASVTLSDIYRTS